MDIMDPFTDELLSAPPLPPMFFDDLSPGAALEREQYLRAIGVFGPPLPPADFYHAAALKPMSLELYADVPFVRPVIEAPAACAGAKNYRDYDANLRKMEEDARLRPLPDYLETVQAEAEQPVLSPLTRGKLVEWMAELVRDRKLGAATLHRAVCCADRALSAQVLHLTPEHAEYQLRYFAAGAVVTAAKHDDRRVRRSLAAEVACYCGFASRQEVLDAELLVAGMLDFDPGSPTAHNFLEHYFTRYYGRGGQELMVERRAHQLADSSLADYGC